jgi:hypothetical protein
MTGDMGGIYICTQTLYLFLSISFHQQHKTKNKTEGNEKKRQTANIYMQLALMIQVVLIVRRSVYLYNILPNDVCRASTGKKDASITTLLMAWCIISIVHINLYFTS